MQGVAYENQEHADMETGRHIPQTERDSCRLLPLLRDYWQLLLHIRHVRQGKMYAVLLAKQKKPKEKLDMETIPWPARLLPTGATKDLCQYLWIAVDALAL